MWNGSEWVDQGHGDRLGGYHRNMVRDDVGLAWDGRDGRV